MADKQHLRDQPHQPTSVETELTSKSDTAGNTSSGNISPKIDFTDAQVQHILDFTRNVVDAAILDQQPDVVLDASIDNAPAFGLFVTLSRPTLLRACRGRWGSSEESLGSLLTAVARDTAKLDHRFASITAQELPYLNIDVSLMYDPAHLIATGEDRIEAIQVGRDGLVINHPRGRGLLLPHVATEAGWDAKAFLDHLALKAGLPVDAWRRDPQTEIMTFQTKLWTSQAPQYELDVQSLQSARLHCLLDAANGFMQEQVQDDNTSPLLLQINPPELGIHLQSESGATATAIGTGHTLLELTEAAVRSLKDQSANSDQKKLDSIKRVTLLWQPISLVPSDYPNRHVLLSQSAVRIRHNDQWRLVLPEKSGRFDTVGQSLSSMQLTAHQWLVQEPKDTVSLTAFAVMPFESRDAPAKIALRQPARAGQFYPADAKAMHQAIDAHFANGKPDKEQIHRAVMLPHAGWKYCGDTIGKTLVRIKPNKTVIIIGPKHTPHGAIWSISPHRQWRLPGATIPVATHVVERLVECVPDLVCEPDAHREEHGCEVLLPFLHQLEPEIQVVPIVMGQTTYEATAQMADGLAKIIEELDALLVISSDMNHFANEQDNRKLDHEALNAMLTGNPKKLYETCITHQISMCGLLPAVTVMQALQKTKPLNLELVDYCNSAEVTGDTSRVVGYAGMLIQ